MSHKGCFCTALRIIFYESLPDHITSVFKILQRLHIWLCSYHSIQGPAWTFASLPLWLYLILCSFLGKCTPATVTSLLSFTTSGQLCFTPFAWSALFPGTLSPDVLTRLSLSFKSHMSSLGLQMLLYLSPSINTSSKIESFPTLCPTHLNFIDLIITWHIKYFFPDFR